MAPRTTRTGSRPGASVQRRPRAEPALPGYLALAAFAALVVVAWALWSVAVWVLPLYLGVSLVAVAVYASDKRAAKAGRRRVPENTLHLLAVAGGWPGAIVAQQTLRHKTAKRSFRAAFWASVIVNVALFVAFSTPLIAWLSAR